jgi:hypothetical protein
MIAGATSELSEACVKDLPLPTTVEAHGNVFAAAAFLYGVAVEQPDVSELSDRRDGSRHQTERRLS